MHFKKLAICACVGTLALIVACGKQQSPSPISPSSAAVDPGASAAADGSTLKVTAPTPVSPINNQQPDGSLVLTATKARGKFADIPVSYEFEVFNASNQRVYTSGVTGGAASGSDNVSHTVGGSLEFDQPHTWRARGVFQGAVGPWSSTAAFRTPSGGYIRGAEIFDPLSNGRTVGTPVGPTQFVSGRGIELMAHEARVTYVMPETLVEGELSVMVTGIDEGSPGDKSKIFTMQEGFGDPTTNDYRFTVEKRGRSYVVPGAVTWRMITGNASDQGSINDGFRTGVSFSDERWYFWKASWRNGFASVEVREDGPNGRVIYSSSKTTNGHPYRPAPHVVHLGQPPGRGGPEDASIPGAIYKNVWVSARPRPNFPGE
ncbi:MAG: hypothetical protein DMF84_11305 [Acidobacteria bacterium]|nr:MAG: hypothetical protein DMF84_11305 [Acidobacteriota bacterium]